MRNSTIFAKFLQAPEGPVALSDGTWLIVEGSAERGCVTRLSADGVIKDIVKKTGRPNGLTIDATGTIWVAESKTPSLLKLTMDGICHVVATGCGSEPFLFPNDLCFGPDGAIYLTDSGIFIDSFAPDNKVRADFMNVDYDGRVYRIDPLTSAVSLLDRGLSFTNGIAFGPDHRLYVNETLTGNIYRYQLDNGVISGSRELFGNVIREDAPAGWKGPDGMAFDRKGFLYVAVFGQGDVTVLDADGQVTERIATAGMLPTNVAFALQTQQPYLHVTEYEYGQMERFPVCSDGLPLWNGRNRITGELS